MVGSFSLSKGPFSGSLLVFGGVKKSQKKIDDWNYTQNITPWSHGVWSINLADPKWKVGTRCIFGRGTSDSTKIEFKMLSGFEPAGCLYGSFWGVATGSTTIDQIWLTSPWNPKIGALEDEKSFSNGWCSRFQPFIFGGVFFLVPATLPFKQTGAFLYNFAVGYHKDSLEKARSPALKYPHVGQNSRYPRLTWCSQKAHEVTFRCFIVLRDWWRPFESCRVCWDMSTVLLGGWAPTC